MEREHASRCEYRLTTRPSFLCLSFSFYTKKEIRNHCLPSLSLFVSVSLPLFRLISRTTQNSSYVYRTSAKPSAGEPLVFKTKLIADGRSTTTTTSCDEARGTRKVTSHIGSFFNQRTTSPVFGAVPFTVPTLSPHHSSSFFSSTAPYSLTFFLKLRSITRPYYILYQQM